MKDYKGVGLIGLAPTPASSSQLADPLNNGAPSFIQQLRNSQDYKKKFKEIISIYLSSVESEKSFPASSITFGGYSLEKYGKPGAPLRWLNRSEN